MTVSWASWEARLTRDGAVGHHGGGAVRRRGRRSFPSGALSGRRGEHSRAGTAVRRTSVWPAPRRSAGAAAETEAVTRAAEQGPQAAGPRPHGAGMNGRRAPNTIVAATRRQPVSRPRGEVNVTSCSSSPTAGASVAPVPASACQTSGRLSRVIASRSFPSSACLVMTIQSRLKASAPTVSRIGPRRGIHSPCGAAGGGTGRRAPGP